MMKKFAVLIFLLLMQLFLIACINTRGTLPYGKWESTEPHIIIDINEQEYETSGVFNGYIYEEDKDITVFFTFAVNRKELSIYNVSDELSALFNGSYHIKGDKLYYKLKPY